MYFRENFGGVDVKISVRVYFFRRRIATTREQIHRSVNMAPPRLHSLLLASGSAITAITTCGGREVSRRVRFCQVVLLYW